MSNYICKRRVIELSELDQICPKCAARKWSMNLDYKECQRFNILPIEATTKMYASVVPPDPPARSEEKNRPVNPPARPKENTTINVNVKVRKNKPKRSRK